MNKQLGAALILSLASLQVIAQNKAVEYDLSELAKNHKLQIVNRDVNSFSEGGRKGIRFLPGKVMGSRC